MNKKALKICLTCFASFLILVFVFGPREPVRLGTGYDNIMTVSYTHLTLPTILRV